MTYSVRAYNCGSFRVPGPEVYWMHGWGTYEDMNVIIFLVQGGGRNILINTGPPRDLTILNEAWLKFFGYPEAQITRSDDQLPENILHSQGLTLDDISAVIVTPASSLRDCEYSPVPKGRDLHFPQRLDRGFSSALLPFARSTSPADPA